MFHLLDVLALLFQAFLLRGCRDGARKLSTNRGYAATRLPTMHGENEGLGLVSIGMEHEAL
jgi:hypothetical protein